MKQHRTFVLLWLCLSIQMLLRAQGYSQPNNDSYHYSSVYFLTLHDADGEDINHQYVSTTNAIGAFVDGELRGVSEPMSSDNANSVFLVRVWGDENDSDIVTFRIHDKDNGLEYVIGQRPFGQGEDTTYGMPSAPITMTFTPVEGIKLSTDDVSLMRGSTANVSAVVYPADHSSLTANTSIGYESSDESIFTVQTDGTITAKSNGTATLIARLYVASEAVFSAQMSVSVYSVKVADVTFDYRDHILTMGCDTEEAVIHYTMDGSPPTAESPVYTTPLTMTRNCSVRAVAVRPLYDDSNVANFEVDDFKVSNVEFTQAGNQVTLSTATEQATIHYTSSDSAAGEQVYTDVLTMTGDCTIEAWATRDGYNPSDTTRHEFYYTPVGVAEFDGLVATVSGELMLDDAFKSIGGRTEAAKTLCAIVWDKDEALTADMLAGLTANPNLLVYVNAEQYAPEGVQNIVVNGVCEQLVLTDKEAFFAPQPFTAQRAEYTHRYSLKTPVGSNQGWETLVLPFTAQTIMHETNGEMAPFAALTEVGDTRKPFWLYSFGTGGYADGMFVRAAQVEAYKPYLIAMPNSETYKAEYLLAGDVTFSADQVVIEATATEPAQYGQLAMVSTLQRVTKAESIYALNTDGEDERPAGSVFISDSRDVLPFECYMTLGDTQGAPRLLPIQEMMEESTAIDDVPATAKNRESRRYDLGGRELQKQPGRKSVNRKVSKIVVFGRKKHVTGKR